MSAKESTSFLIEAWALDSGSPAESASLFSLDNGGKLDLVVAGDGNLKLVTDIMTVTTTLAPFTPNEWHHVALNVLRGTASEANLIVDGTSAGHRRRHHRHSGTGVCCRQSAGSLQHRRSDGLSGSRLAVRQASAPARCCLHHPRDDQHWAGQHLQSQAGPIGRRPDSVRTRVEARAMCSGLFLLGKQLSRIRDHLQPEIDQIHHPEIF